MHGPHGQLYVTCELGWVSAQKSIEGNLTQGAKRAIRRMGERN